MDELLEQFVIEGRDLVQQAADSLMALEQQPGSTAHIGSAFRAIHTLKGSAGLFDLAPMSEAMHAAEDSIGAIRDGRVECSRASIDPLLDCVGAADRWIEWIARTGGLPADAASRASQLAASLQMPLKPAAPAPPSITPWMPALLARHPDAAAAGVLTGIRYAPTHDCFFLGDDPIALMRAVPGLAALDIAVAEAADPFDPFACTMVIEALSTAPASAISPVFRFVADQVMLAAPETPAPRKAERPAATGTEQASLPVPDEALPDAPRSFRVDAARVDAMVDIAGELIVAKNRLAHLVAQAATSAPALAQALGSSHADIDRLVGAMHRAVMGARMVPLSQTIRRLPRLVRDIAAQLGRDVRFDVSGGDTEADKAIADGLYEPLLHILRNAIDHGIEAPADRRVAGKPTEGLITLDVTSEAGEIVVTVSDDGAGIDPARLRQVAKARGMGAAATIDALDDASALDLIFAPGFSTAAAVTAISGRGVGMDAVRNAVQALGGTATITSRVGAGSVIRLVLPQAAAITTIVIVRTGPDRFGVPIGLVAETIRIPRTEIIPVHGGSAFVLRDRSIPLLHLSDLLHLPPSPRTGLHAKILIAALGNHRTGLVVDSFEDRSDVLLRPLGGMLSGRPGLLGAALLGDGQVLMVLDLPGLIG